MKRLNAFAGGRLRVWWVHHRRDAVRAVQLIAIVAGYLTVSTMDYEDQIAREREAREDLAQALAVKPRGFAHLPRTTFVIEARTEEELRLRLAEIAGELDGHRADLRRNR